jgi:malonate-semialdehyde dehydrogenase (acetylating)/methylmalonate-semialdehyde dehydrogenase
LLFDPYDETSPAANKEEAMIDLNHYVSGAPVPDQAGRFADVFNPATGAVEKRVPLATTEEVGEVVAVAKAAWPA